jgi:hypothetical protein
MLFKEIETEESGVVHSCAGYLATGGRASPVAGVERGPNGRL